MSEAYGRSAVEDERSPSEHLSPELALIDPELAQKAREQLGDPPRPQPAAQSFEQQPPPPPRRRRRRRALGVGTLAVLAVASGAGVGIAARQLLNDDLPGSAKPSSSAPALTSPQRPAQTPVGGSAASESPRTFGWVPVERARYYRVSFFRGKTKIFETWPKRPPLVLPARWTYKGRAHRLGPGVYRWIVRPGFGPRRQERYGEPIVDASLVIRN